MKALDKVVSALDTWQRSRRLPSILVGVIKKFGDDDLNQFVVGLGWYGFVGIYPLLLVVVTVLGFIGAASLSHHLIATLHAFPVVGPMFNPARGTSALHGSTFGLVIGLAGMLYGAQGVTQTAQQSMARVWNIPQIELPGFLPRLIRSITGLAIIGAAFVGNAAVATLATGGGHLLVFRALLLAGMVVLNVGLYVAAFRALTPSVASAGALVPGAIVAALGFTFLITLGSGLVQHQLRNSSATYGQFGTVIGLVAFLFLLAKISLYGAELNPVLHRQLWPRGLQASDPTEADDRVLRDIAQQNRRREDQCIEVGFGETVREPSAADVPNERRAHVRQLGGSLDEGELERRTADSR
jgi:uncharacterized BrkB/YihY/UPF0761 family membrane protein